MVCIPGRPSGCSCPPLPAWHLPLQLDSAATAESGLLHHSPACRTAALRNPRIEPAGFRQTTRHAPKCNLLQSSSRKGGRAIEQVAGLESPGGLQLYRLCRKKEDQPWTEVAGAGGEPGGKCCRCGRTGCWGTRQCTRPGTCPALCCISAARHASHLCSDQPAPAATAARLAQSCHCQVAAPPVQ